MSLRLILICLLFTAHSFAKKNEGIVAKFTFSEMSIIQKKGKLILKCKPLKIKDSKNFNWITECNSAAFNILNQEYYQNILVEKYVEDQPFGNLSYSTARDFGNRMLKKSIRKAFKIHKK